MLDIALDGLMDFIDAILEARATGMEDDRLNEALRCQRAATFLIDFVEAENSQGFHAPQESGRIFFKAMDYLRKGNIALGKPAAVATVSETAPESMSTSPVEAPSTPPIESAPPPLDPAAAPAAGV